MNRTILGFTTFAFGATIGTAVTWKYLAHKYEQHTQEEISTFKQSFVKRQIAQSVTEDPTEWPVDKTKADMSNVVNITNNQGYTNYSDVTKNEEDTSEPDDEPSVYAEREGDKEDPFVISPEEFGENEDYDRISLTYYMGDGILADDNDELIESVDSVVGLDSLDHFGEYEDDSVFVRNDRLRCDFEILKDGRRWVDVTKSLKALPAKKKAAVPKKPHQMED